MKYLNLSITILLFTINSICFATVQIAKHENSKFVTVPSANVQTTCGINFVFRDQYQKEIPAYLEPEIIKISFKGEKLSPSLQTAKAEAEKSHKCIWYAESEKADLGV